MAKGDVCDVCGTDNHIRKNSGNMLLCNKHYLQMKRHGKILERTRFDPNEIITKGEYSEIVIYDVKTHNETCRALVDTKNINIISKYKWCNNKHGYAVSRINGKVVTMHRFIMDCSDSMVIDHINHNTLDNRESNLRICSQRDNCSNQVLRSTNKSGHKGVYWNKQCKKWAAQITTNGKTISFGLFSKIDDAIKRRNEAENEHQREFRYQGGGE